MSLAPFDHARRPSPARALRASAAATVAVTVTVTARGTGTGTGSSRSTGIGTSTAPKGRSSRPDRAGRAGLVFLSVVAGAALLSGCTAAAQVAPEHDDRVDGSWMLVSAIDDKGTIPLTDAFISLRLGEGQSASQGPCNSYTVSIDGYGDDLVVSNLVATELACAEANINDIEARYFADLSAVTSGTSAGGQLILKSDTVTLTYVLPRK